MTDKFTAGKAMREGKMSFEDLLEIAAKGKFKAGKKFKREDLKVLLEELKEISQFSHQYNEIAYSQDIQLVQFQVPGKNLIYVTLLRGGEVILSKDTAGDIDLSNIMPGFREHVVDAMAKASMALDTKPLKKKKVSKKGGGSGTYKPTKDKPGYVSDPCIEQFFRENARSLAHADLRGTIFEREPVIISGQDALEKVIVDEGFLKKARQSNLSIKVEPIKSYLARHRKGIKRRVEQIVGEIINKPEVRTIASKLMNEYSPAGDRELKDLQKLCSSDDIIFDIYRKLDEAKNEKGGDDPVECYVICLRELAIRKLGSACENGTISDEDFETFRKTTRGWVGRAKAADEIKVMPYIQEKIIPKLKGKGEDEKARDKIFDAICEMGKLVMDPNHLYGAQHFNYLVDGLWMEGLMEKEVKGEITQRTPAGAKTEYADGLGNLLENFQRYDSLLRTAFSTLLDEGRFDKKWLGLETQGRCVSFGKMLYAALPDREKSQFRRIKGPDVPLTEGGTYLAKILRAYVGINREHFAQVIEERRSHNAK